MNAHLLTIDFPGDQQHACFANPVAGMASARQKFPPCQVKLLAQLPPQLPFVRLEQL